LDCNRKIGLTLNDSLLMSPSKSVTALIGVAKTACRHASEKCVLCYKTDCVFRK
jgi:5-methyltetrahydrofolate--homocysteine methyltransferase